VRLIRLTRGYARCVARLVPGGSTTSQKLNATIRELARAPRLPLPGDIEGLIPPSLPACVRRVPGAALWLWYTASDTELTLRALTAAPP